MDFRGGGRTHSLFGEIISPENLFGAWKEFLRGKSKKKDVQEFEMNLEDHVFELGEALKSGTYVHGGYRSFYVNDPKRRHIHKPTVRDRLVHHAVFRVIEPLLNKKFIFDVWSCRTGKGTHSAIVRFQKIAWALSRNNTRTVWVLKLDIRKYFDSVDQGILMKILRTHIEDEQTIELLEKIILSFPRGIPLGNLTSQLFANVYLNELDQYVKRTLCAPNYIRYCDDMVITHISRAYLEMLTPLIADFLSKRLALDLHPKKILLTRYHGGVDVLGYVCFPYTKVLRTTTKRRMEKRLVLF